MEIAARVYVVKQPFVVFLPYRTLFDGNLFILAKLTCKEKHKLVYIKCNRNFLDTGLLLMHNETSKAEHPNKVYQFKGNVLEQHNEKTVNISPIKISLPANYKF